MNTLPCYMYAPRRLPVSTCQLELNGCEEAGGGEMGQFEGDKLRESELKHARGIHVDIEEGVSGLPTLRVHKSGPHICWQIKTRTS